MQTNTNVLTEEQLSTLPTLNINDAQKHLEQLLALREESQGDFSVVSMCCGSGRTPTSQHWPIKEVRNAKNELSTFRYKDTIVTLNTTTNQLELVTYGPGTGKNSRSVLDAALGVNPTIEDIMTQQQELYQMICSVRRSMQETNSDIKVLPKATLIGFSRGAAAVQKMSGILVTPLHVELTNELEEGFTLVGDWIEITKGQDCLSYTIHEGDKQTTGTITSEDWPEIASPEAIKNLKLSSSVQQEINKVLWRKGEAGAGINTLVDTENTTWISLDAVAGRKDVANDHYFNNDYCKGVYVMSTRLASDHALAGFGATFPIGDGMIKVAINGKHGAVFDDQDLRKVIIDGIHSKKSPAQQIDTIKNAVINQNDALLNQSVLMTASLYSNDDFKQKIIANPNKVMQSIDDKLKEKEAFIIRVGQRLGLGVGEARRNERYTQFEKVKDDVTSFIQDQNQVRKATQLPSLEGYAKGCSAIDELIDKLENYIKSRENATDTLTSGKALIANDLFSKLTVLRCKISLDSNLDYINSCVREASSDVNDANKKHKSLVSSHGQFRFFTAFNKGEGELGGLLQEFIKTLDANKKLLTNSQDALRTDDDAGYSISAPSL